jgi:predicted transcriptional regulator
MSRRLDGARNFFLMPQKIFNLGMNAGEIAVYAYLMFRENRKTYQCYPSYRTIGEAVGMSRNTVKKYVDALVEKQLIYVEPTKVKTHDGGLRNGNLLYTIRPLEAALEYHLNQQMKAYSQQPLARQGTSPV